MSPEQFLEFLTKEQKVNNNYNKFPSFLRVFSNKLRIYSCFFIVNSGESISREMQEMDKSVGDCVSVAESVVPWFYESPVHGCSHRV